MYRSPFWNILDLWTLTWISVHNTKQTFRGLLAEVVQIILSCYGFNQMRFEPLTPLEPLVSTDAPLSSSLTFLAKEWNLNLPWNLATPGVV